MSQWTPSAVRKTILFAGMVALGVYLLATGSTTEAVLGALAALGGVGQAMVD